MRREQGKSVAHALRVATTAVQALLFASVCVSCSNVSESSAQSQGPPAVSRNPSTASQSPAETADPRCASATTQLEMTTCWGDVATEEEKGAEAAYVKVGGWLRDRMQDSVASALNDGQVQWRRYRDLHCAMVADVYEGGSIAGLQRVRCRAEVAAARRRELETLMSDASN